VHHVDVQRIGEVAGQPGEQQIEDVVVRAKAQRQSEYLALAQQLPQGVPSPIGLLRARAGACDVAAFQICESGILVLVTIDTPEIGEIQQADDTGRGKPPAPPGPQQHEAHERNPND
jgi:hypothetical protein